MDPSQLQFYVYHQEINSPIGVFWDNKMGDSRYPNGYGHQQS
jgi:hypothetical protein